MSNTATANLLVPMFLALAGSASGNAMVPALAVTLGCSLAFCFPVATPPNAIVYGSGHVPLVQMIRAGVLLDLGCGVLAWAVLVLLVG
jgi:sodium-dependent dicarboxylate transporter 2/3/5